MWNRAAPVALARTICRPRSPAASGTPCRNCLAGNTSLLVQFALFAPLICGFLPFAQRHLAVQEGNALHGGPRRPAVRAVKGAQFAFIGAKRRPFTEEAGG